jgi:hypothetical protein
MKRKHERRFPVVYVEWYDSESVYGWREPETMFPKPIRSIGVLVHRDKNMLVLSTSKTVYGKHIDQLTIPMCSVRKIKKVRIP